MSRRRKVIWSLLAVYIIGFVVFAVIYGVKGHKNESFSIIDAYHIESWAHLFGPVNLDKGALYVLLAGAITVTVMLYVALKMERRPGRLQVAVEWFYDLTTRMAAENLDEKRAKRWFPFICTLFVFILVTNLLGYIPLPVNSAAKFHLFGADIPSFQIYAADTNVAVPFLLALFVFISYNVEGIRAHGFFGYIKSLVPQGVGGAMLLLLYPLEILSNFLRLLSLTIRLWANLLAGHLLIDFMAGALAVLLGLQVLGWFTLPIGVLIYLFEAVLIAGLQAFIFAILTAIYLGGAVTRH
jgi:F-type H+-transporting ATPase subunit a